MSRNSVLYLEALVTKEQSDVHKSASSTSVNKDAKQENSRKASTEKYSY